MKSKNLFKSYIHYLLPTLGTMVLFSTYTMVDGIFVGKGVGRNALSAVNLSMPYVAFLFSISMLISIGSSNIITHYLGENNKIRANKAFSIGLFLSFSFSILITIISYLNLDFLIELLGATPDLKSMVKDYLSVIILFSTFFIMTYIFEIMVKADGAPHLAIIFMIVSALTNITLDYIFIFVFDFGVKGAAVATGIAQTLPCIGYFAYFKSEKSKLEFIKFKITLNKLKKIIIYGFPASLTELSTGFIILLFNNAIAKNYDEYALSTFSVIAYVFTLVVNTMLAINQSAQPLTSFYYGAKNFYNVKKIKNYMLKTVLIIGILIFLLIQIFPRNIFDLFFSTNDLEFLRFSIKSLKIFSLSFLILGFNIGIGGYLTAIKNPKHEFLISTLRGYLIISACIFIVPKLFDKSLIWYILFISEILTLIISIILINISKYKLNTSFKQKVLH